MFTCHWLQKCSCFIWIFFSHKTLKEIVIDAIFNNDWFFFCKGREWTFKIFPFFKSHIRSSSFCFITWEGDLGVYFYCSIYIVIIPLICFWHKLYHKLYPACILILSFTMSFLNSQSAFKNRLCKDIILVTLVPTKFLFSLWSTKYCHDYTVTWLPLEWYQVKSVSVFCFPQSKCSNLFHKKL